MNISFDVLGTLLTDDRSPAPPRSRGVLALEGGGPRRLLVVLRRGGVRGGAADLLGVADLVSGCLDKREGPDVSFNFAVGDDAAKMETHGGHRVKPFDGDPREKELSRVAEAIIGSLIVPASERPVHPLRDASPAAVV